MIKTIFVFLLIISISAFLGMILGILEEDADYDDIGGEEE